MNAVAVTGHRSLTDEPFVRSELARLATKLGATSAICGMALGADMAWAEEASALGVPFHAYVPFPQQPDKWPAVEQQRWTRLLAEAATQRFEADSYSVSALHARNRSMIADADVLIAVWDRATKGGTWACLRDAVFKPSLVIVHVDQAACKSFVVKNDSTVPVLPVDLFDRWLTAKVIVNAVNTVGVMGAGIAKAFADSYPAMVEPYREACQNGSLTPGGVFWWQNPKTGRWVANVATKGHWRDKSQIDWVADGLIALRDGAVERGADRIAMPKLGCGLGGLDWSEVRVTINATFAGHATLAAVVANR